MELVQEEQKAQIECCPEFHSEKWEGRILEWKGKKFIKATVPTLFHIPLPPMIGNKVRKLMKLATEAKKLGEDKEGILLLFRDPHAFKSEMYLSVTGNVPSAQNTTLSGTFMSKVFDGPFKAVPQFMKEMDAYLAQQGKKAKDYYIHYASCPKCAKEAGHNYMVMFARIKA